MTSGAPAGHPVEHDHVPAVLPQVDHHARPSFPAPPVTTTVAMGPIMAYRPRLGSLPGQGRGGSAGTSSCGSVPRQRFEQGDDRCQDFFPVDACAPSPDAIACEVAVGLWRRSGS